MTKLVLPYTGLEVDMKDEVVYRGELIVDDVEEAVRQIFAQYGEAYTPTMLEPGEMLSGKCIANKGIDGKMNIKTIAKSLHPYSTIGTLGHEEFHAACMMDVKGIVAIVEKIEKLRKDWPLTNELANLALSEPYVKEAYERLDLPMMTEVVADIAGTLALEKMCGWTELTDKARQFYMGNRPRIYGQKLASTLLITGKF